jgi:hypothetical protein
MKMRTVMMAVVLGGVALTACVPASAPEPTHTPLPAPSEVLPTKAPTWGPADAPRPEAAPPTEGPPPPTPTTREGLQASDPGGVDLASGTPTLVEFFAFW